MTGRIKIIRKVSSVVDGRRQQEETEFYSCWCEVKSLGTNEKYTALQTGLENTIVFETRTCDKMEEIRLNLKEFYATYKGVEFKIRNRRIRDTVSERCGHRRIHRTVNRGGSDLMRILVESLKRMYTVKKTLTKEQIAERVARGSISAEEYEYITGEKYSGGDAE